MDIASVIGLVLCFVMVIFGILSNAGVGGLPSFVDVPSAIITFGGAFSAILASKTMADFVGGCKRDNRIGRFLHQFNQIAVYQYFLPIQLCQLDHTPYPLHIEDRALGNTAIVPCLLISSSDYII